MITKASIPEFYFLNVRFFGFQNLNFLNFQDFAANHVVAVTNFWLISIGSLMLSILIDIRQLEI